LVYEGYEPAQEGLREALCTLGNGYFATRGAAPDAAADDVHYPGTYLAGGYDRARTLVHGREVENEDLVNLPNWLPVTFRFGGDGEGAGDWFSIDEVEVLEYRMELDLHDGLLRRDLRFRDAAGRTTRWTERRLVSMARPHLAALCVEIAPEDWEGTIEIRSGLDGRVVNDGVGRYRELEGRHLDVIDAQRIGDDRLLLRTRTRQSRLEVAQVVRTRTYAAGGEDGEEIACERGTEDRIGWIAELLPAGVGPEAPLRVEKVAALHCSRDRAITEPATEAAGDAAQAGRFAELLEEHRREWHQLWDSFDLQLGLADDDEERSQRRLRLHTFHLLQTASPHSTDLDVGVPARGWHGEAYRGHIFWDELFIFPTLNLRMPLLTRALLQYRYRRLPEARRAAREAGYRGAMFPWQSGSNGREESQKLHLNPESGRWIPDNSHRQRHIGAAIAYNAWHYHQVTDDHDFLHLFGAELILEIARFWASIARYNRELDRYEIRGVMGPDEYHTAYQDADPDEEGGLDNNAYTNVMAAWVLERAHDVLHLLPAHRCRELREDLGLGQEEIDLWQEIARTLRLCFHGDGILSQFEGYEALEEFDWTAYRQKHGDIQRLDRLLEAEGDSPNRYKASKQADVLMLFYLFSAEELEGIFERLGYRWDRDFIPRNIAYYLDRTSHGSTLSWVTHAWVLARSDRTASWQLFQGGLESDVCDIQGGTTPEGIHVGAMAGTVDLIHRCYTGIEVRGNALHFDPCLPEELRRIRFRIRYRRQLLNVEVTQETLEIESQPFAALPITIAYRGHHRELSPGERCRFRLLTPEERERETRPEEPGRPSPRLPFRRE
jgi:alpha,alpha-trehalase